MKDSTSVLVEDEAPPTALQSVTNDVVEMRKEAVDGRAASGIEERWQYAEDAYNSKDESTRQMENVLKPATTTSGFISVPQKSWNRSTAFLNITRPYVDTSGARVSDMLFPTDDRNWEIRLTPKQEAEDMLQMLDQVPEEYVEEFVTAIAEELQQAEQSILAGQQQIDDWLNEVQWNYSGRKLTMDSARIGTGVVKGPVPMDVKGTIQPGSKVVKAQNCFPDPDCGDNIHDGEYFFERETIVPRKLRAKIQEDGTGWQAEAIKRCLEEGPKAYDGSVLTAYGKKTKKYELWHFQGEVSLESLLECGCSHSSTDAKAKVWANLTICNDYIVRAGIMPQQDRFSYDVMCWQEREGYWAGIGVAEQLETPQRGLNASIRNLFDNAALSAIPQIVYWKGILDPVDGKFELYPGKRWQVTDSDVTTVNDVKNAIMTIEIPSRQNELMEIIALMRDLAQETTGLPLISQGLGSTGVVGSDQLATNAASTVLRRLAKEFDGKITVPHITAYYEWIKRFEVLDIAEAVVDARGSAVLVERDIQAQALLQMVQMATDPSYGLDPKLVAEEWVKSQKFDPKKVKLTPEREQEIREMMAQPDEKAQAAVESAQLRANALTEQTTVEAETDRMGLQLDMQEAQRKREHDKIMLDLKNKYELISYAKKQGIDLATAVQQLRQVKIPEMSVQALAKQGEAQAPAPTVQ